MVTITETVLNTFSPGTAGLLGSTCTRGRFILHKTQCAEDYIRNVLKLHFELTERFRLFYYLKKILSFKIDQSKFQPIICKYTYIVSPNTATVFIIKEHYRCSQSDDGRRLFVSC